MENIGTNIMELRKGRGVAQEALAEATGVSIQAVSKWENGGCPDTALLPAIADYFEVSIDSLFGRDPDKYSDIRQKVRKHLFAKASTEKGNLSVLGGGREVANELFEICFAASKLLISPDLEMEIKTTAEVLEEKKEDSNPHLTIRNIVGGCTTLMNLKGLPYFMLMPEPKNGWRSGLLSNEEYTKLFGLLSDPDTFKAILWLCTRPVGGYDDPKKPLTKKGIQEKIGFSEEQAAKQIEILLNLKLITQQDIELDDVITATYTPTLAQTPILPVLAIANELIHPLVALKDGGHYGHRWNGERTLIDMEGQEIALSPEIIKHISSVLGFDVLPEHFGATHSVSFNNNGTFHHSWKFLDLQGRKLDPKNFEHNNNGNIFGSNLGDVFISVCNNGKPHLRIDIGSSDWGRAYNVTLLFHEEIPLSPDIINRISSVLGFDVLPEHFGSPRSFDNNGIISSWKFLNLQGRKLDPKDFEHNNNGNIYGSGSGDVFISVCDGQAALFIDVGDSEWGRAYNVTSLGSD